MRLLHLYQRARHYGLMLLLATALTACDSALDIPPQIRVTFEGTVTSNGAPVAGAVVAIEASTFVFQSPVATATTDATGNYRIVHSLTCVDGQNLRSPGLATTHLLTVKAAQHEDVSSVNINRELFCIRDVQRVDFTLRRVQ